MESCERDVPATGMVASICVITSVIKYVIMDFLGLLPPAVVHLRSVTTAASQRRKTRFDVDERVHRTWLLT